MLQVCRFIVNYIRTFGAPPLGLNSGPDSSHLSILEMIHEQFFSESGWTEGSRIPFGPTLSTVADVPGFLLLMNIQSELKVRSGACVCERGRRTWKRLRSHLSRPFFKLCSVYSHCSPLTYGLLLLAARGAAAAADPGPAPLPREDYRSAA